MENKDKNTVFKIVMNLPKKSLPLVCAIALAAFCLTINCTNPHPISFPSGFRRSLISLISPNLEKCSFNCSSSVCKQFTKLYFYYILLTMVISST